MFSFATPIRRLLTAALALLIVAKSLHCAWEWQAALKLMTVAAIYCHAGQPLPVGLPRPGCDNESGCLCRGATLSQAVDLSDFRAMDLGQLPLDLSALALHAPADDGSLSSTGGDASLSPPPLSGRQMRALYASLVI